MLSANSFTSYFQSKMPFIYLFFLTAGAKIFSAMLNISGKSGHPCFVPDLRVKAFSLLLLVEVEYKDFVLLVVGKLGVLACKLT